MIGSGMDPDEIGQIVKTGVLADRFFILTERGARDGILRKLANILEAFGSVPRIGTNVFPPERA
jgi:hypothetical protein